MIQLSQALVLCGPAKGELSVDPEVNKLPDAKCPWYVPRGANSARRPPLNPTPPKNSTSIIITFHLNSTTPHIRLPIDMSRGRGGGRGGRGGGRGGRQNLSWDTGEEPDARPSDLFPVSHLQVTIT